MNSGLAMVVAAPRVRNSGVVTASLGSGARSTGRRADGIVNSMAKDEATEPALEEKPSSLAALAYGRLYSDITSGKLAPGQKLLAAELSAAYAVGLSPLRDALNRLCADGLAVKREQKGFFVADLDEGEFLQITNTRLVIEEAALRLSIAYGDTKWEEAIVLAFYRLAKAGGSGDNGDMDFMLTRDWSAAHQEFHFALLAACRNDWLLTFCKKLYEQTARYRARRRMLSSKLPIYVNLVQAHKDIMDRCLVRDADGAAELLVQHYKTSFELVTGVRFNLLEKPRHMVPVSETKAAADGGKSLKVG